MDQVMARKLLWSGAIFDELTLIRQFKQPCGKQKVSMLEFKCSCGHIFNRKLQTFKHHLLSLNPMDCGQCELNKKYPSEYTSWIHMNSRCYCATDADYENYGGRGIKVCDRWRGSFRNFIEDMGRKPFNCRSLDRKDNDKDYSKENCRWADEYTQNNNRRPYAISG